MVEITTQKKINLRDGDRISAKTEIFNRRKNAPVIFGLNGVKIENARKVIFMPLIPTKSGMGK